MASVCRASAFTRKYLATNSEIMFNNVVKESGRDEGDLRVLSVRCYCVY